MEWHIYRVALRLEAPLHIGRGKISYLQRTRPYVPGRTLRGALVSRLARQPREYATPGDPYHKTGQTISQYMAFTYFFPALKSTQKAESPYQPIFPWKPDFRRRFLSSYAGTALAYPQQTAAHGLLREIEYIAPYTRDTGEPVYLLGYIFVDEAHIKPKTYDWQSALHRIQLGGERGYGWGKVGRPDVRKIEQSQEPLFDRGIAFDGRLSKHKGKGQARPVVIAQKRILAHVPSPDAYGLRGAVEPVVGREWRPDHSQKTHRHIGKHLAFKGLYFAPGGQIEQKIPFMIDRDGFWLPLPVEEA